MTGVGYSVAAVGAALLMVACGSAQAAGNGSGHAALDSAASLGSSAAAVNTSTSTGASTSGDATPKGNNTDGSSLSTYGEIGTSHTTAINDSTYLQLDGGVNFDQKSSPDSAGSLNGRVGLGLKF